MGLANFSDDRKFVEASQLPQILRVELDKITTPCDVTPWMDLIRTSRHPQVTWVVDYIEPRTELLEINKIIEQSEEIIYGDLRTLSMKEGYSADISQEVTFHTIRAHLRAEKGEIEQSIEIFTEILSKYYDYLPVIRQSNLLMHCSLAYLCTGDFDKSYECFK